MFFWRRADDPLKEQITVWSVFPASTKYIDPGKSQFMLNYIVDDLDATLEALRAEGVQVDERVRAIRLLKLRLDHGPGWEQDRTVGAKVDLGQWAGSHWYLTFRRGGP